MRLALLLLALTACGSVALAASNTQHETAVRTPSSNPKTLVIINSPETQQTHSAFFSMLTARGHQLDFVEAGEGSGSAGKLVQFDVPAYDGVMLFAPTAEDLGEDASVESLQRFVDLGRNVLIVGDVSVSEPVREILAEMMGIDVDEEGTRVQDPKLGTGDKHDLVQGERTPAAINFVGSKNTNPVLFRGLGHVAQQSSLVTPVLTGSPSATSDTMGSAVSEYPAATGRDVMLVSAMQTRNNARMVYCGSIDMFSNDILNKNAGSAKSGNEEFVRQIAAWTFQERGLLRASQLKHWKVGAEHDVNPGSYRVQDHIVFSIVIEEFDGETDAWKPYTAEDVQLEFTMLDPYLRATLPSVALGKYSIAFQVPDVYGVYKFVVPYARLGYSTLEVASQVSVHPFRHDEFERFLLVAYPYYSSAFTIMAAFFVFGVVFLYHKE